MADVAGVELTPVFGDWRLAFPDLATMFTDGQDSLDELATIYAHGRPEPGVAEFLIAWIPGRLLDIAYGSVPGGALSPTDDDGFSRAAWVAAVYGSYLGVWLHKTLMFYDGVERTGPGPTTEEITALATSADHARAVANGGTAEEVFALNRESVRGGATDVMSPAHGEINSYGHNAGYMEAILGPGRPTGVVPVAPDFFTTSRDLLDARFSAGDSSSLTVARAAFDRAERDPEASRRVREVVEGVGDESDLRGVQATAQDFGLQAWSSGGFTDISRWGQDDYDDLLANAVCYVQCNQANVLAGIAAYALQDEELGRRQARAVALLRIGSVAYLSRVMFPDYDDRRLDDLLPTFV